MLNPLMRSGDHIDEMLRDRPEFASRAARAAEVKRRLAEVGIVDEDVARRMPFQLSGGMCQRVALAAALARDPELLIADEPSTALDVTTQAEIIKLLRRVQRERHMSLILITHNLRLAFSTCRRIYVLYAGSLLEVGDAAAVERQPFHPYTLGLLCRNRRPTSACLGSWRSAAPCRAPPMSSTDAASPTAATGRSRSAAPASRRWPLAALAGSRPASARTRSRASSTPCAGRRCRRRRRRRAGATPKGRSSASTRSSRRSPAGAAARPRGEGRIPAHHAWRERRTGRRIRLRQDDARALPRRPRNADRRRHPHRRRPGGRFRCHGEGGPRPRPANDPDGLPGSVLDTQSQAQHRPGPRRGALGVGGRHRSGHAGQDRRVARRGRPVCRRTPGGVLRRFRAASASGWRSHARWPSSRRSWSATSRCRRSTSRCRRRSSTSSSALQAEHRLSYLFITHDLAVVRQIADRIYVLYLGEIVEEGPTERVIGDPQHPYTRRLVESIPRSALQGAP